MSQILALDLATKTGWCRGVPGQPVEVGTHVLPKTGSDIGTFLNAHQDWLDALLLTRDVSLVIYESPILRSGNTNISTLRKLYGLAGVTEMVCVDHKVRCVEVMIQKAKKALAGHARADKAQMMLAAERRNVAVEDDNQADAFGVFLTAIHEGWPEHASFYDPLFAGKGAA